MIVVADHLQVVGQRLEADRRATFVNRFWLRQRSRDDLTVTRQDDLRTIQLRPC